MYTFSSGTKVSPSLDSFRETEEEAVDRGMERGAEGGREETHGLHERIKRNPSTHLCARYMCILAADGSMCIHVYMIQYTSMLMYRKP